MSNGKGQMGDWQRVNGMGKRLLPWGYEATILVWEDGKKKSNNTKKRYAIRRMECVES